MGQMRLRILVGSGEGGMCPMRDEYPEGETTPETGPVILVVEDDVMVRIGISEHLRRRGYQVIEAASGLEARALLDIGWTVDAVFSDVKLPELRDGIELALWIELNHPDMPVVLASGSDGAVRAAAKACANVRQFVVKPYDFDAVEALLRGLTEKAQPKG